MLALVFVFFNIGIAQTGSIGGVVNHYAGVTSIKSNCLIEVDTVIGFKKDDIVLIVQMKGGTIDLTNSALFGTLNNLDNAGKNEINVISYIEGDSIYLKNELVHPYDENLKIQIVGIRPYSDLTINSTVSAKPWNGNTGGIVFLNATEEIKLSSTINVSGQGYRGGKYSLPKVKCGVTDYYIGFGTGHGGEKGESFILLNPTNDAGRGPSMTGGGGGNNHNTGGGGGGNYGAGGVGGKEFSGASGACVPAQALGGLGGNSLDYSTFSDFLFMGGGGGGPHQNNYPTEARGGSKGGPGGGLVVISTNRLIGVGTQKIESNGESPPTLAGRDGAGGGGAGGTIFLDVNSIQGDFLMEAKGGNGGDLDNFGAVNNCHGPGGGGGGGIVISKMNLPSSVSLEFSEGVAGLIVATNTGCANSHYGATDGTEGGEITGYSIVRGTQNCPLSQIEANNDFLELEAGNSVSITDYLSNDVFSGDIKVTLLEDGVEGTGALVNDDISYTTPNVLVDKDTLEYEICRTLPPLVCDKGFIIISITPVNQAPIVKNDTVSVYLNEAVSIDPLLNDFDPESGTLTFSVISVPNLGNHIIIDNQYEYQAADITGVDIIEYQVCDDKGACATGQIVVYVKQRGEIIIPTGFSPNNDGINDYFEVVNLEDYNNVQCKIINRWGGSVYETNDYLNNWDGSGVNDKPLPDGTYFYEIILEGIKPFLGYVVIHR